MSTQAYTLKDILPGAPKLVPGQLTQIVSFTYSYSGVMLLARVKVDSTTIFCPCCGESCHKLTPSHRGLVCGRCLKRQAKPYSEDED